MMFEFNNIKKEKGHHKPPFRLQAGGRAGSAVAKRTIGLFCFWSWATYGNDVHASLSMCVCKSICANLTS